MKGKNSHVRIAHSGKGGKAGGSKEIPGNVSLQRKGRPEGKRVWEIHQGTMDGRLAKSSNTLIMIRRDIYWQTSMKRLHHSTNCKNGV